MALGSHAVVSIRTMTRSDLDFATRCTAEVGWVSETRELFETFWVHDPGGCFLAEAGGEGVGICVATPYGRHGFVGELIVTADWRGRGIGRRLLDTAVQYLHQRGALTVLLDGVVEAVGLYERAGFRRVCRSLRFRGLLDPGATPGVRPMEAYDLPVIDEIDRAAFGADRSFFLAQCLSRAPELCRVAIRGDRIDGFITGRSASGTIPVGPWVMRAGSTPTARLLRSLAAANPGCPLRVGVLEGNSAAQSVLRQLGFEEIADPPWRMALGPSGDLGFSPACCAIGSAAKG